jgi:YD repeat-containing protein
MCKIVNKTIGGFDYEYKMDEQDRPLEIYRIKQDGTKKFVCSYEYYGDILKHYKREDGYESDREIVNGKVVRDYDNQGNEMKFKYDDRGNIIEKVINTQARQETHYFEFDDLNRITRMQVEGGYTKTFTYHGDTEHIKHTEDSMGMEYDYYENGRVKSHRDRTNGIAYSMEYYQNSDIVKRYIDNKGNIIEYNEDGSVSNMTKTDDK